MTNQMITAIDPGTAQSAFLRLDSHGPQGFATMDNAALLAWVRDGELSGLFAIEMVACYGLPVGREVFETCLLIGQLKEAIEARGGAVRLVYRRDVKIWLCGSMKAKDGNVRQALIDKYGAPGTKKHKGKTYGISSHLWSALAIADFAYHNPNPQTP